MANRLEQQVVADFTGGLNLRSNQFQLKPNESPEMANIVIDPLGGIFTRKGWERWNEDDIVDVLTTDWNPRRAFLQQFSDGTDRVYVANLGDDIYAADADGVFEPITVVPNADPHGADFATWGDVIYISTGWDDSTYKIPFGLAPVALSGAGAGTWNDDYTTPTNGVMPQAQVIEAHGGYIFAANIDEDGLHFPNRLRWSHPDQPEDWAEADFQDISIGGSKITGLMSYEDHLLIFKDSSVWAWYGMDQDTWQLVQKSTTSGAPSPCAITRSESAVYYYSSADRGAIFAYTGERPVEIGTNVRRATESLLVPELVWVGWIARKLWVTVPWNYAVGATEDSSAVLVFDPTVGDGAWIYFDTKVGALGPLVFGSDVESQPSPLAVVRSDLTACVVRLDAREDASDVIFPAGTLATPDEDDIVTGEDEDILIGGSEFDVVAFRTYYRTGWMGTEWPDRKKSWRRPGFVCRETGILHELQIRSYRDYEENIPSRQSKLVVTPKSSGAVWGEFDWGDGTTYGPGARGGTIKRGSSFGQARSISLRLEGLTPTERWGVDAIIMKVVMRRFR